MLNDGVSFALNGANNLALRTVSRACCRNGSEYDRFPPLNLALLAEAVVQHEGVKQGNYDALL
jgi:hypothetical protein